MTSQLYWAFPAVANQQLFQPYFSAVAPKLYPISFVLFEGLLGHQTLIKDVGMRVEMRGGASLSLAEARQAKHRPTF